MFMFVSLRWYSLRDKYVVKRLTDLFFLLSCLVSNHGQQILISIAIIVFLGILSIQWIQKKLGKIFRLLLTYVV